MCANVAPLLPPPPPSLFLCLVCLIPCPPPQPPTLYVCIMAYARCTINSSSYLSLSLFTGCFSLFLSVSLVSLITGCSPTLPTKISLCLSLVYFCLSLSSLAVYLPPPPPPPQKNKSFLIIISLSIFCTPPPPHIHPPPPLSLSTRYL